ncbi:MAG: PEP-utilizing enzyme [Caldilineaceae bacterium]
MRSATNLMMVRTIERVLAQGVGLGQREVVGRIVHIQAPVNGESYVVGPQDIIFVNRVDRSCLSLLQRAGGLITVEGGLDSAGAIFAMDLGLPALIGAQGHIDELIDGAPVVLDTTNGQVSQWRKSMPIMRN